LQVFQDICLPGKGKINSLKNEKITQMGIIWVQTNGFRVQSAYSLFWAIFNSNWKPEPELSPFAHSFSPSTH
jgi:hypothetical protein